MARIVRLTPRYVGHAQRLRAQFGPRALRAAARAINQLAGARDLPGAGDVLTYVPDPDLGQDAARLLAHAHRVSRLRLWVWYWPADDELQIVALTDEPPVA